MDLPCKNRSQIIFSLELRLSINFQRYTLKDKRRLYFTTQ